MTQSTIITVDDSIQPTEIAVGPCDVAIYMPGVNRILIGGAAVGQSDGFPLPTGRVLQIKLSASEGLFGHATEGEGDAVIHVLITGKPQR
jgi:hypothetical protein